MSYRRQLAGYEYAVATGRDRVAVAAELGLGHLSPPDSDDFGYWIACGTDRGRGSSVSRVDIVVHGAVVVVPILLVIIAVIIR